MISQHKNRVQAIKNKFENLNTDSVPLIVNKKTKPQLNKHFNSTTSNLLCENVSLSSGIHNKENKNSTNDQSDTQNISFITESESSSEDIPKPNSSYLYNKTDINRSVSNCKKSLTRQISDPGKKLHRSHAFRCDRSQKINDSPKRHGSCHGRSESSNFVLKSPEKRLSKERLKKLGNVLEDHMKRENFVLSVKSNNSEEMNPGDSIPDSDVPKHILDQYAKVDKTKKKDFENKQDGMTDSGVSSETEIAEEDKTNKVKQLLNHFEKPEEKLQSKPNLEFMNSLCASTETMRIERKNPHLQLTDTLKKALKQPLPMGPPPKKPPRVFAIQPITEQSEKPKKDTKKMLEKLEQVLQQREAQNQSKNIYDVAETNLTLEKPKEIHYLCTEILDITHKTLLPNHNLADSVTKCLTSLNCAIPSQSMSSLPYTRMSIHSDSNRNSMKMCCSCSTDSLDHNTRRLSTFLGSQPCVKCQSNEVKDTNFKCHLNCNCKDGNSKFFVEKEKEHIYDVPFVKKCDSVVVRSFRNKNRYGTLNSCKNHSKSMEDLRTDRDEDQKIYDIPCEESRPATPEPEFVTSRPKMEFQKLRSNFENGCVPDKPTPATPKPILINRSQASKSSENLEEKKPVQAHFRKFNTERRGRDRGGRISLPKRNHQLDVDKENLNRLMSEIYEAVTACNMEENKPVSFPTDNTSSSEESIKLTRSLTEKRKNYLRRVSSKVANLENRSARFRHQTSICSYNSEVIDNPYSTFRSWKSFRTSQQALNQSTKMASLNHSTDNHQSTDSKFNLTDSSGNVLSMRDELDTSSEIIDNLSVDEKADCIDIELPFEPRERGLFNVCLLVGLNYMSGEAYVKSVFPSQVQVPPHIENLIFPETLSGRGDSVEANSTQCYSIVLTNERGDRCYGYCRRVLPEGASTCLPLCYCLIGKYRAPGFYYKVLEEIESHHGSSDEEISNILQQLFETDLPDPGQSIQISTPNTQTNILRTSDTSVTSDSEKCKTLPVREKVSEVNGLCRSESEGNRLELYDLQNNNAMVNVLVDVAPRIRTIKMPIEPRTIEDSFSILLDTLGAGLVIKVFASMLLERKVILFSDSLSLASSCLAGLQQILYPLVWQQPLISLAGSSLRSAALDAPLPILCAAIRPSMPPTEMPEGMLLDLTLPNKVLIYQGDESTILPAASYKTLKTALQMETGKHKDGQTDTKTRNVMISEAFLRFFVDIFGDFWRFFSFGELKDDGLGKEDVVFDKEAFIKNAATKQNQYFLEWFIESSMFIHFIQNMAMIYKSRQTQGPSAGYEAKLVDTPLPNFYEIFEERTKVRIKSKSVDKGNYKNAMNKRMRLLKNKLRDLIA